MIKELLGTDGVGNTRPERTLQTPLNAVLDWVSVTFHVNADFHDIIHLVGLGNIEFEHHEWGRDTFTEHIRFSNIVIQRKKETTYQLSLSGQGCREYENLSNLTWLELFEILKEFCSAKFTRLDLAIDDFTNKFFNVDRIRKYLNEGLFVSRIQEWEETKKKKRLKKIMGEDFEYEIETIKNVVHFGSMDSRFSVVFYDKKLEREAKGRESDGTWENWTRTELRLKREYADQTAEMIMLYQQDLGKVAFGILNKNVRFVTRGKDTNIRRRKTAPWWDTYVGDVEKLSFTLKAPERTIEKAKEWLKHGAGPSFAAIYESDKENFENWLNELLQDGISRLTEKHGMMIAQSKELRLRQLKKKILKNEENAKKNKNEILLENIKKSSVGHQGF